MGSEGGFKVTVTMKDVIAAALPMQEHWLPLTNLDLLLPAIDVGVALCYKGNSNGSSFKQKVSVIRRALAEALRPFYAFSGQLVTNFAGEPDLLCNNRGVDFIEAFADVKLSDLHFHNADQSLGKFMPVKKEGVLAIQVTELKCGAIMLGSTFDHRVADACSANMFLVLWSEMATYKPISVYPCFRRLLLSHRHPAKYDPSLDDMYLQLSSLKSNPSHHRQQTTIKSATVLVSRIYHVSVDELCLLQLLASKNGCCKRTKLQSFCAFLWKMVAFHACQSGHQNSSMLFSMGIIVDGRTRLSNEEGEHKKEALASYFGNVLSIPYGQQQIADLKDQPLSWVADRVLNFLEPALKKDHFMDLIDWVEAHKPGPALAKIYSVGNESGPAFVVSSGLRFPISQVDFGWGKPIFGSYHFPWKGNCGYVMPMPSPKGNGDWVVYMQLPQSQLDFIEANAPTLFKPFSMNLVCSDH